MQNALRVHCSGSVSWSLSTSSLGFTLVLFIHTTYYIIHTVYVFILNLYRVVNGVAAENMFGVVMKLFPQYARRCFGFRPQTVRNPYNSYRCHKYIFLLRIFTLRIIFIIPIKRKVTNYISMFILFILFYKNKHFPARPRNLQLY